MELACQIFIYFGEYPYSCSFHIIILLVDDSYN